MFMEHSKMVLIVKLAKIGPGMSLRISSLNNGWMDDHIQVRVRIGNMMLVVSMSANNLEF